MAKTKINMGHTKIAGNTYIAGQDMHFGAVQNSTDLVRELEKLRAEFDKAVEAGLDREVATDAQEQVGKAITQARQPQPNKARIVAYLKGAMSLVADVTAASGMVTALGQAVELVQKLF